MSRVASVQDRRTHARKIAEAMLKVAGGGNVTAFMAVLDRIDGSVPRPVEISSADGEPLVIEIRDIGKSA